MEGSYDEAVGTWRLSETKNCYLCSVRTQEHNHHFGPPSHHLKIVDHPEIKQVFDVFYIGRFPNQILDGGCKFLIDKRTCRILEQFLHPPPTLTMSVVTPDPRQVLTDEVIHLNAVKYFQVAAYVILIYDHILTFSDEIEHIWKHPMTGASIIFLIIRYGTPLQFIVIMDAFLDPIWTSSACKKFIIFEGASTAALVALSELIMILRIYALYKRNDRILMFLLILWILQIVLTSIGLNFGIPAPLRPGLIGCILIGSKHLFSAGWVTPLITDGAIFFLMLWKTRHYLRQHRGTPVINTYIRDGSLYYLVIFVPNLLNAIICSRATGVLKIVGASFSQLVTATVTSRLVINLRSTSSPAPSEKSRLHTYKGFMSATIGNLGEELDTIFESDDNYSTFSEEQLE